MSLPWQIFGPISLDIMDKARRLEKRTMQQARLRNVSSRSLTDNDRRGMKDFGPLWLAAASLFMLALAQSGAAAVCYVDQAAGSGGDGSSWSQAYNDLQTPLNFPINAYCSEVWVAKGTYKPAISDRKKSFTIRSGQKVYGGFSGNETSRNQRDPDPTTNGTVLSGGINPGTASRSYHVVFIGTASPDTVLDSFTISHGRANGTSGSGIYPGGGGLYCEGSRTAECSPTLRNLVFANNFGNFGGGMLTYNNASPTLTNIIFERNRAKHDGGAMYAYMKDAEGSPAFENVAFTGNKTLEGSGGAIYAKVVWDGINKNSDYEPAFSDVTFDENQAIEDGGAIRLEYNGNSTVHATFEGVTFSSNSAKRGGAIFTDLYEGGISLTNATFHGNSASQQGGALWLRTLGEATSNSLRHTTFSGNSAPSIGSAAYLATWGNASSIQNSIFWGNTGTGAIRIEPGLTNPPQVSHSIIEGGCPAHANCTSVTGDDPQLNGLTNTGGPTKTMSPWPHSPAINGGTDIGVSTDQRGVSRPQGGASPDIGAVELRQYTVSASVQSGQGTIVPMARKVPYKGKASFDLYPDSGYYVTSATGCGGQLDGSEYTTGPITGSCTIIVEFDTFQPSLYRVKATVTGGSALILPSSPQWVVPGSTVTYSATPLGSSVITSASGCGGSLSGQTYTTAPVNSPCTVNFVLKPDEIFDDRFEQPVIILPGSSDQAP